MEENTKKKVLELAEELIDLKYDTEEMIIEDEELHEKIKELISEYDKILNQ